MLVGGRMAFTFLAAQGVSVGATQVEGDKLQLARDIILLAAEQGTRLLLPCDVRMAASLEEPQGMQVQVLTQSCCRPDAPCIPAGELLLWCCAVLPQFVCRPAVLQQVVNQSHHSLKHDASSSCLGRAVWC
jgi:hypothetical protein